MGSDVETARRAAAQVAAGFPSLSLVVLFGSRARGDARESSDWDLAYEASAPIDPLALRAAFADALGTDRVDLVDLVDLSSAGALLRFRAARDGTPLHEREQGTHSRFWQQAVGFWCDIESIVRTGHDDIIAGLTR